MKPLDVFAAAHAKILVDALLAPLKATAHLHGYALALHGSVQRDVDLVAIPWIDRASDVETLLRALSTTTATVLERDACHTTAEQKPHGRTAFCIHIAGTQSYLDVSVMPRLQESKEAV